MIKCPCHLSSVHHASEITRALCPLRSFGDIAYFSTTVLSLASFWPPLSTLPCHSEPSVCMCDHQSQRSEVLQQPVRAHECAGKSLLPPVALQLLQRSRSHILFLERRMKLSNSFPINCSSFHDVHSGKNYKIRYSLQRYGAGINFGLISSAIFLTFCLISPTVPAENLKDFLKTIKLKVMERKFGQIKRK